MPVFTAIDGGTVGIGGEGLVVQHSGATRIAVFAGELGQREFTVGNLELGEKSGLEEGVRLTEEYRLFTGGTLRIGAATEIDAVTKLVETAVLGVWLGTGWSAHMWAYGVDSTAMLNIFNAFAFAETPTGVVMTSRDPQRLGLVRDSAWAPHVACYVQGLGLVDVFQRTHVQEAQVPTKPGASVAGGELWVEQGAAADAEGPADVTFLLANGTALARIYAEISEVPEATLIDRCSRLTVDWRAA